MMQRRRYQLAHAPAEHTEPKIAAPVPEQDVPEIELDTFVGAAMAEYLAARGTEATVAETRARHGSGAFGAASQQPDFRYSVQEIGIGNRAGTIAGL